MTIVNKLTFTLMALPVFVLALVAESSGQAKAGDFKEFNERHQAGARIGVWANLGETPGENLPIGISTSGEVFSDANFYIEGYLGYRFSKVLVGELSIGIVSRGEAVLRLDNTNYIGNVLVYPVLVKAKLYPVTRTRAKVQPYLFGGGGIFHVRHDIQFATGGSTSIIPFLDEDSETSVSFLVGGGIDWPVATVVALNLHIQYLPIKQTQALIGVDDWSSVTVTLGASYLFRSSDNKNDTRKGRKR